MKPSDQDPHCFQLLLKIHAYNWNAGEEKPNRVDPGQTASSEAVSSGSALFVHFFVAN